MIKVLHNSSVKGERERERKKPVKVVPVSAINLYY